MFGAKKARCPGHQNIYKLLSFPRDGLAVMNRLMKKIKFDFGIVLLIAVFIFGSGCSKKQEMVPISRPFTTKIKNVQTGKIIDGRYLATISFHVGDQANMRILAVDKGLDIQKIYVRGYYPKNAETPHLVHDTDGLGSQSTGRNSYFLKEPFDIPGPPGEWRLDIQIEDDERNLSNLYQTYLVVH